MDPLAVGSFYDRAKLMFKAIQHNIIDSDEGLVASLTPICRATSAAVM
jgi:hypothetical protein